MEINFRTKEESNRLRQEEFLKLSPEERFYAFLELSERMKDFPTKAPVKKNDNFIIVIEDGKSVEK